MSSAETVDALDILPSRIIVLSQPFAVEAVGRDEALYNGAPESAIGTTNLDRQTMRIRAIGPGGLSIDQFRETLLHETLHAIFYLFDLKSDAKGAHAERLINRLAPALYDTFRRNPALVQALMEGSE